MIYQPVLNKNAQAGGVRYRIRYEKNYELPNDPKHDESHIHNCYEIYINLEGDVSFWVNNKLYPIKSGDIIATRSGDVHMCVYHSPAVHEHFCLWFEFDGKSAAEEYIKEFFENKHYSFAEKKDELAHLFFELYRRSEAGEEFLQSVALLSVFAALGKSHEKSTAPADELMPPEMQRIVDDINENFAEFKTVKDIIERYYISQATLNRYFRKYLHISPREYLEAKKLARATTLLSDGKTVTEACMLSGFSDSSHFISVFKKKFGETPFKYKSTRNQS